MIFVLRTAQHVFININDLRLNGNKYYISWRMQLTITVVFIIWTANDVSCITLWINLYVYECIILIIFCDINYVC